MNKKIILSPKKFITDDIHESFNKPFDPWLVFVPSLDETVRIGEIFRDPLHANVTESPIATWF